MNSGDKKGKEKQAQRFNSLNVVPPSTSIQALAALLQKMSVTKRCRIAIAVLPKHDDSEAYEVLKYIDSNVIALDKHPLDTSIFNLLIEVAQNYPANMTIISSHPPTSAERGAIKILELTLYHLDVTQKNLITSVKKGKIKEESIPINENLADNDIIQMEFGRAKICISNKPRLKTQDAFLWCEDLQPTNLTSVPDVQIQDELYMGLLYSALFILPSEIARPYTYGGRRPVGAMLVDKSAKPIAFSLNTAQADKVVTHAETGMLLRYLSQTRQKQLPQNTRVYTTLETCEMCRPALDLSSGGSGICEIYGQKDDRVKNACCSNQYHREAHVQTVSLLGNVTYKNNNNEFYNFCKANYLGLKSILENRDRLPSKFSALFNNIEKLMQRLLNMRVNPYVGNPVLYEVLPSSESGISIVKEKDDFSENWERYFGGDISQYRVNRNNSGAVLQGDMKITAGSRVSMPLNLVICGGSSNIEVGEAKILKTSGNSNVIINVGCIQVNDKASGVQTTWTNSNEIKISKADIDRQQGAVMGFDEAEKKIGKFIITQEIKSLIEKIFVHSEIFINSMNWEILANNLSLGHQSGWVATKMGNK